MELAVAGSILFATFTKATDHRHQSNPIDDTLLTGAYEQPLSGHGPRSASVP